MKMKRHCWRQTVCNVNSVRQNRKKIYINSYFINLLLDNTIQIIKRNLHFVKNFSKFNVAIHDIYNVAIWFSLRIHQNFKFNFHYSMRSHNKNKLRRGRIIPFKRSECQGRSCNRKPGSETAKVLRMSAVHRNEELLGQC